MKLINNKFHLSIKKMSINNNKIQNKNKIFLNNSLLYKIMRSKNNNMMILKAKKVIINLLVRKIIVYLMKLMN